MCQSACERPLQILQPTVVESDHNVNSAMAPTACAEQVSLKIPPANPAAFTLYSLSKLDLRHFACRR